VVVKMELEVLAQGDGVGGNEEWCAVHAERVEPVIAAFWYNLWRVPRVRNLGEVVSGAQ
jgi:hypothetical protein